jgi:hypothetical protein
LLKHSIPSGDLFGQAHPWNNCCKGSLLMGWSEPLQACSRSIRAAAKTCSVVFGSCASDMETESSSGGCQPEINPDYVNLVYCATSSIVALSVCAIVEPGQDTCIRLGFALVLPG